MIRNQFILAASCSLLLVGHAVAADLPSRRAPPVFVPPPAAFTWTGVYLGVNAGYAFQNKANITTFNGDPAGTANAVPAFRPPFLSLGESGFAGGGQVGYNYEFSGNGINGVVVGAEADADYTDLSTTVDAVTGGRDNLYHTREAFVGTVRGRVGYAFDRFLIYGTGGFAYGKSNNSTQFLTGPTLVYSGANTAMQTGIAYGGGVEYALPTDSFLNFFHSSAVTLKAEFIHYDLGTTTLLIPNTAAIGAGTYTERVKVDGNMIRGGLNFKFGVPDAAPVVARY